MSSMEGLDIRAPIGGLFTILGVMLAGYGLVTPGGGSAAGTPDTSVNVWWGLVMILFGVMMLLLARRAMARTVATREG
jgi:predicted phage tail protein